MTDLDYSTLSKWIGIALCVSQSAIFSGLNLALFGISRLNLEVEVASGNARAKKLLALRKDSNFLLATILWGNVAANCLLTLLSDSVLAGISAFLFSTIVITCVGEIVPQAYFSRNALRMAAMLSPVLRIYQVLLYVVAKPTGVILDWWLGKEGMEYYRERDLREVIKKHVEAEESDLEHIEGRGALNFMTLDDLPASEEGEPVDPASVVSLPVNVDLPVFPKYANDRDDPFVVELLKSGRKWVILTDPEGEPQLVLDADEFARDLLLNPKPRSPYSFCHRPIVVANPDTELGDVISKLKIQPVSAEDDVIDNDIILVWAHNEKRIITGADILGRLMRGIASREKKRESGAEPTSSA
jgi:metal transporter CNNM